MPRARKSFELFAPEPVEAPRPDTRPVSSKLQLWLAVCLPSLALESLAAAQPHEPAVVVEAEQGRELVVASSAAAANAGIVPGMKLSTAFALAASLQVFERTPSLELASLESLAGWAETLTSTVSIEAPESVLLEVAGSLKLFGSVEAIKAKLEQELARRYANFRLCVAPTPTAALWLARAARSDVLEWRQLAGSLASLPLTVTRWSPAVLGLLRDLGLRTVGECVRLPRDGLARRVGRACLLELDRAFGRSVDLRAEFKPPRSWSSRAELGEETVDRAIFSEAIEQLLDELIAELRKRQVQIGSFELAFEHLHRPSTIESFDLREPTHDRERLLNLIADRLERSVLPVPAVAVRMRSGAFKPLELEDAGLFEAKPFEQCEQMLLERLQERFGVKAVYGLCVVAEHRPEKAWGKQSGAQSRRAHVARGPDSETRPLWLLPVPVAIEARRGSLELCSGPERIESGWWDEQDVARDYYTAKNSDGQTLWVFRDHRTRRWFLHGLFG
jgi:protein ImuB